MKAILLAAGEGLRIDQESVAKPLLRLNGQTILGRLLDQLIEIGDIEPIIVIGYDPTRFLKMFWDKATFAYVPAWDTTGPLYSLLCISHLLRGGALVGHADMVTTANSLSQVVESPNSTLVTHANQHYSRHFALENGRIVGIAGADKGWQYRFGGFAHFSELEISRFQQIAGFEHASIGPLVMGFTAIFGESVNVNTQGDLECARELAKRTK